MQSKVMTCTAAKPVVGDDKSLDGPSGGRRAFAFNVISFTCCRQKYADLVNESQLLVQQEEKLLSEVGMRLVL